MLFTAYTHYILHYDIELEAKSSSHTLDTKRTNISDFTGSNVDMVQSTPRKYNQHYIALPALSSNLQNVQSP